jgi:hypothetical protein
MAIRGIVQSRGCENGFVEYFRMCCRALGSSARLSHCLRGVFVGEISGSATHFSSRILHPFRYPTTNTFR